MGAIVLMITAAAFGAAFDNVWLGLGIGGSLVLLATMYTAYNERV